MSKSDSNQRPASSGQLKKDIQQAKHALNNLTNNLAKIDSSLADNDAAHATEARYIEKISNMQREITEIQNRCSSLEEKSQREIMSFATANMHMNQVFQTRLKQKDEEHESKLLDIRKQEATVGQRLRQTLESQKAEIARLERAENTTRQQLDVKWKEQNESCKMREESLKSKLEEMEKHMTKHSVQNQDLTNELREHQIMLKGRDTEISRLGKRLSALEAFSSDSPQQVKSVITTLQSRLQEFCVRCVKETAIFPGWKPIPKGLLQPGLPRNYSAESVAGRSVLTAAIQHSIWGTMVDDAFGSHGLLSYHGMLCVANALHRTNPSKEAVWRVLTVNAILESRELLDFLRKQLDAMADRIVTSWEIFQDEHQRNEFRTELAKLLYSLLTAWLSLLRLQKRISLSLRWDGRFFETDSGEDSFQVPGDFVHHDAATPILYLSPAFLEDNTDGPLGLLQKGKVMLRNSPLLLTALTEEQKVSSPKLSNKTPIFGIGSAAERR